MPDTPPRVTDLELMVLQQIWQAGEPQTVYQIVESWPERSRPGYTTILKTLQKMEGKCLVGHQQDGRRYAYFARVERDAVAGNRLETIIERMFGGNRLSFAQYFIESGELSARELRELKRLVAQAEKGEKE